MGELLQYTFYIPDYQRGYRWTAAEVRELLNDLKEYQETRTKDSPPPLITCNLSSSKQEKRIRYMKSSTGSRGSSPSGSFSTASHKRIRSRNSRGLYQKKRLFPQK